MNRMIFKKIILATLRLADGDFFAEAERGWKDVPGLAYADIAVVDSTIVLQSRINAWNS